MKTTFTGFPKGKGHHHLDEDHFHQFSKESGHHNTPFDKNSPITEPLSEKIHALFFIMGCFRNDFVKILKPILTWK
jgi:hypothetical protein